MRYRMAATFMKKDSRILDIACGTGYGSQMLARFTGQQVVGVDSDISALKIGVRHYNHANITFQHGDIEKTWFPYHFGLVVCLETLEHLKEPELFLSKTLSCMGAGATIVISVPVTEKKGDNPYHIHFWRESHVMEMFQRYFVIKTEVKQTDGYLLLAGTPH